MIRKKRRLNERIKRQVAERITECEKRGGVSASLFLDGEMNDALPYAKCFFYAGTPKHFRGFVSVFFPEETTGELTAAYGEGNEAELNALFLAAIKECEKNGIETVYTVVNPAGGFRLPEEGLSFRYSYSEYFLCRETGEVPEDTDKAKAVGGGEVRRQEVPGEPVKYSLYAEGEEVTYCYLEAYDGGRGWYLYHLETAENHRRKGYATRLICEVLKEAAARGGKVLRLQVSSRNVAAERLYRGLDFVTEEQRDYYYTERTEA